VCLQLLLSAACPLPVHLHAFTLPYLNHLHHPLLPHSHHPTHIVANPSRRPAACFCPSTTYELLRHDLFTTIQGQFIRFDHIFLCILAAKVNCCFLLSALHPSYRRLISVCLRLSSRRTTCSSSVHPTYLNSSFGPHDINDRHF
jgi:hypothetical protein